MNNFTIALIIVLALTLFQTIYGLAVKAKSVALIGLILALICALALAIDYFYGGSIYLTGDHFLL
ncbi:MAG: hypothetical protein ACOYI5_08580 [Christensenellales bacterium]|jgi:hypothetical protein